MTTEPTTAAPAPTTYEIVVDGRPSRVEGPAMRPLVVALRDDLDITGPKVPCGIGVCGACSVLLDGELVSGCLVPVAMAAGRHVTTVAGLTPDDGLSPLQAAFVAHGASQCGFCTPGQVVAATALLTHDPDPSPQDVTAWMAGNLCRCTGYVAIVEAILDAADGGRQGVGRPGG
jgi:carbon-monoxide dehydrogenase small subunit